MSKVRHSGHPTAAVAHNLALFAAVSLTYYAGGIVGLNLRLPPAAPAVLWPPNSILTVALLCVPPRRWPVCFAAALAAHLAVQLPGDWPTPLVWAWYVTNCTEAVIAAAGLRLLGDTPIRFDTLRQLGRFLIIAVAAAPLIATFADAFAVSSLRGDPYWRVWQDRLVGSVLGELVIVPAGVGLINALQQPATFSLRRRTEAAVLGAALLFTAWPQAPSARAVLSALWIERPMFVQLPLVLWIATRFGVTATSLALLWTTATSAWAAVSGHSPFNAQLDPASTILALQLLLIGGAMTLLSFAVLLEERTRTQRILAGRLDFEAMLSRLSAAFVHLPSDRMDTAFAEWLSRLGTALGVDAIHLFNGRDDMRNLYLVAGWTRNEHVPVPLLDYRRQLPWTFEQLRDGHTVVIESLDTLPGEADLDTACLRERGINCGLVVPLVAGHAVSGAMCFGRSEEREWPHDLIANLRLVAEVFANALARKRTEDALRVSEAMKSSILESFSTGVSVIDADGNVRAVNENWARLTSDGSVYPPLIVGDNLLRWLRDASRADGSGRWADVLDGIDAVVAGDRDRARFEHALHTEGGVRWFVLLVTQLKGPQAGAVLTYADITERRRDELEVQRSRQELAHATRFATMGEMAVSLAHQLNQPLAAIMTNANAATTLLGNLPLDVDELRAILDDIAADDRRAGDVIQHLRDLLHRDGPPPGRIDLGKAIRDAVTLVQSDAVIRNISLTVSAPSLPVRGDMVQLQQAVLNVVVNALEAIGEAEGRVPGQVSVACERADAGLARVRVRDTGPGVTAGNEELMFEAFYTTKPHGVGMGLSIARSIVEAHGGTVRVVPDAGPGGCIELTLPLDDPPMVAGL